MTAKQGAIPSTRLIITVHLLILLQITVCGLGLPPTENQDPTAPSGVAVLLIDTDRVMGTIEPGIYGHFLEHINHSVVDGLFAEQIRGQGFEGRDFETYWKASAESGRVEIAHARFLNGEKSVRLEVQEGIARIMQDRVYVQEGHGYGGSMWLKTERGSVDVSLVVRDSDNQPLAEIPLENAGTEWEEAGFSFLSPTTDEQASFELTARGTGSVLIDFVSLMSEEARENGMLRPDLVEALRALKPPFLRWPGGSFASIYQWKDGIGPLASRRYHPNTIWGGYSDYYGFGTEEFMQLCRQLGTEPMVVLPATSTKPEEVEYALEWVHYLVDPAGTQWGSLRASHGHPEPYDVPYFQIDNEPMNHGLTPEEYSEIVNTYAPRVREIAPEARIVACGQKRSNDMVWSQKVIDLAGDNFDILGVHNYEYEPENFETGIRRIRDYLIQLRDYVRVSSHPEIRIGVLEWNLSRTYDWRAGLHAAGSLMLYEELTPELEMTAPALLMRNTSDDPTWTAFIYHDHVSWFPGSAYVVERLFREHYAERHLASTSGTFRDLEDRTEFFDEISRMKPEDWRPGTVDAIATSSADGERIVIKAVNYESRPHTLLARLQGSALPENATVEVYTLKAGLRDAPSLEHPRRIHPIHSTVPYARDLAFELDGHSVVLVEITAK